MNLAVKLGSNLGPHANIAFQSLKRIRFVQKGRVLFRTLHPGHLRAVPPIWRKFGECSSGRVRARHPDPDLGHYGSFLMSTVAAQEEYADVKHTKGVWALVRSQPAGVEVGVIVLRSGGKDRASMPFERRARLSSALVSNCSSPNPPQLGGSLLQGCQQFPFS